MHRIYISVYIEQPAPDASRPFNGTKDYRHNKTPYWIANYGPYAYHYKTGLSKHDQARYDHDYQDAFHIAYLINRANGIM